MKKNILMRSMAALTASAVLLAGCSGAKSGESSAAQTSAEAASTAEGGAAAPAGGAAQIDMNEDPYTVAIQLVVLPGSDYSALETKMEEALNKITLEKINANVDVQFVWISEVTNKTGLAIAGNEKLDLLHVATVSPLSSMVGKDMLYDMNTDNLLQTRGTGLTELLKEYMNTGVVNGQQLAVPAKLYNALAKGVYYNKTVADAAGITVPEKGTMDDLEKALYVLKEKNTEIMPFFTGDGGNNYLYWLEGYMGFGKQATYGAVMDEQGELKVENVFATQKFKDYVLRMNKWRADGLLTKDITDKTAAQDYFNQQQLFCVVTDLNPQLNAGYAATAKAQGFEVGFMQMVEPKITNSSTTEYMWGIASNSERPDKAMDLLNLMYTDPSVANIMSYGIEGENFTFKDGSDKVIETNGSYISSFIYPGDQSKMYIQSPNGEDYVEQWENLTKEAQVSPLMGYMFSDADFQAESAAIYNTYLQYMPTLQGGVAGSAEETEKYLAEYISALEAAGINDVIAGNQEQLDAYLSTK